MSTEEEQIIELKGICDKQYHMLAELRLENRRLVSESDDIRQLVIGKCATCDSSSFHEFHRCMGCHGGSRWRMKKVTA